MAVSVNVVVLGPSVRKSAGAQPLPTHRWRMLLVALPALFVQLAVIDVFEKLSVRPEGAVGADGVVANVVVEHVVPALLTAQA
jgi:hypothetical protein